MSKTDTWDWRDSVNEIRITREILERLAQYTRGCRRGTIIGVARGWIGTPEAFKARIRVWNQLRKAGVIVRAGAGTWKVAGF